MAQWFVSYAWGDETPEGRAREAVVDALCAEAKRRGVEIQRDRDTLRVGQSISAFMKAIGEGDRIFIVLSEKYLQSPYCMFELFEIWRNSRREAKDFLGRVRLFSLPDTKAWTWKDRLIRSKFWKDSYEEFNASVKEHGLDFFGERDLREFRLMGEFYRNVSDILATMGDIVQARTIEDLKIYGFGDSPVGRKSEAPSATYTASTIDPGGGDAGWRKALRFSALRPAWADDGGSGRYGDWASFTVPGTVVTQRLRWIAPGKFLMGSPDGEDGRHRDEGPVHEVTLSSGFWLFDTPCTQALYEAVMGENPSRFKGPLRPVEQVSFRDVEEFLFQLNGLRPGLELSLPSEAGWEYACRAGTSGPSYGSLDAIAWYDENSGGETHDVALKRANRWGLHDMLGNVWEWCADTWHADYKGAPTDGSAWIGGGSANRVRRGGSWNDGARAAYRIPVAPSYRFGNLGFRCARVQERKG